MQQKLRGAYGFTRGRIRENDLGSEANSDDDNLTNRSGLSIYAKFKFYSKEVSLNNEDFVIRQFQIASPKSPRSVPYRNLLMKYLSHAIKRMKLRKITKIIIEDALANPDKITTGRTNRRIAWKRHGDKWIKVIFEQGEEITVITAYWTRRTR